MRVNSRDSMSKTFFQLGMESTDFLTHVIIINSFLFPKGVSLNHCFCWGKEHNYTIFMKKPLLFPSLIIEKTRPRDWSSTHAKSTFLYGDAPLFCGDNNHGKSYGSRIFLRVFCLLLMALLFQQRNYAQTCNIVSNGTFAGGSGTGWTSSGGWIFQTTPRAVNSTDGANGQTLTQTLTGLNGGPVTNQVTINFDLFCQQAGQNSTAVTQAKLEVLLNGVVYVTFDNPSATGSAGKVTATISGGASIAGFDNIAFPGGSTGNVFTDTGISLTIPWLSGSPNSAALTFRFTAPYTTSGGAATFTAPGNGQGSDDFGVTNISNQGTCPPSAFAFNCGTATSTGVFIAGTGSSGTLIVPISGATAGSAAFSVSGTNFTGTLTTTLTAGQTSITIPITYDGTGTIGDRILTVTSSQGIGTCSKSIIVDTDSDSDGITDTNDLDDDNDGILDTVECFYQPSAINSTWTGSGNNWNSGFSPTTINAIFSGVTSIAGQTMDRTGFSNASVNTSPDIFFIYTTGSAPGSITLTFNKPVNNPILHIAGIGGVAGGNLSSLITLGGGLNWSELSESSASYISDATTVYKKVSDAVLDASGSLQISGTVSTISLAITTQTGSSNGNDGIRITLEVPTAYSICSDTDGDGIADKLDLDSDGDGCPDAIEGGANLAASNLVTSTIAGGNSGTSYTGTSTTPVVKNLGNTVGNTATTLGVPTVAGTGQGIGNSENKLVQSANCVTCNAGTTAPILTATTKSNVCPTTSADISALVSSTCPVGSTIEWHTVSTGFAAINKVNDPSTVLAGTYYPVCYDATNSCYSPAPTTGVTVTITICLSITQPATQTGLQSVAKSGTVPTDITVMGGVGTITYSSGSADSACVAPSGASALPTSSNLVINANGAYTYTTPATVGTYYFCVKVCDLTTPTADCKIAIYTVIVSPPPCNVGTTAPKIN